MIQLYRIMIKLACFFAGTVPAKESPKNEVSCIAADSVGTMYAVGVHKKIKVSILTLIHINMYYYVPQILQQVYSYRDTIVRSPSSIHFPFVDVSSEGRIMYVCSLI